MPSIQGPARGRDTATPGDRTADHGDQAPDNQPPDSELLAERDPHRRGTHAPDGIDSRKQLAEALTRLRQSAGLTVREAARRLDVPAGTLGDYFSGRHTPSASQVTLYTDILRICGVADDDLAAWVDALTKVRATNDGRAARARAPYPGLSAFQTDDAELFFGRDDLITEVMDRLADHDIVAVVGASGAGKSSLLRAGVVAAINNGDSEQHATVVTPTTSVPLQRGAHQVLVVDQFEELFTTMADAERQRFLDQLKHADAKIVIGLRADFYAAAAAEPALTRALQHGQILMTPMTRQQLQQAIVEPARRVGVAVDDALVELVLADLAPRDAATAHDLGALPLLSHAMHAAWERAKRNRLTVDDYRAVGGLQGAISQSAEETFTALAATEQATARRLFMRLASIDGERVSRRRVPRKELDEQADGVVTAFVARRLLTVDADTVEVSHEALLTAWPRLQEWLAADRDGLRLHRRLTEAVSAWTAADRDLTMLWRGPRLAVAQQWCDDDHASDLSALEHEFLTASDAQTQAAAWAARRRTRRLQRLVAGLVVVSLVAAGLAVFAWRAQVSARSAQVAAEVARDRALSRQVAVEAQRVAATDPALAAQLALVAYRVSPTLTARSTLLDAAAGPLPTRLLGPSGPTSIALGSAGLLAVTHADDGSVHLYDARGHHFAPQGTVPGLGGGRQRFAVAVSADSRLLATGGTDNEVTLWQVAPQPHLLATLPGFTQAVQSIAFSPDGRSLAAVGDPRVVHRWDLADPTHPVELPTLPTPGKVAMQAVAYRGDGGAIVAGGTNGTIGVWRLSGGAVTGPPLVAHAGTTTVNAVAFSPSGSVLVTGSRDGLVRVWSPSLTQVHAPLNGFTSWVNALSFSADGSRLVAGSSDASVQMWRVADWSLADRLTTTAPVTGVHIGSAGIVTASADGTVRSWPVPEPVIGPVSGTVFGFGYSADGKRMLVTSSGAQGDATLWDNSNPRAPVALSPGVAHAVGFGAVSGVAALRPDGRVVAVGNRDARLQLIDVSDPAHPRALGGVLDGPTPLIEQMTFDPSGNVLAAGDDGGRVHWWDVRDPSRPVPLPTLSTDGGILLAVAFDPNGRLLAAGSTNKEVFLWNVADRAHPRLIATLRGFDNYVQGLAFSGNGRLLAAGSADNTVRLFSVGDAAHPHQLGAPITGPTGYVYQVALSGDGRTLVAGSGAGAVWVWRLADPAHPQLQATLSAAPGSVMATVLSPNGGSIVASGSDDIVRSWPSDPAIAARLVCGSAGTPITRAEWAQYVPGAAYSPPC